MSMTIPVPFKWIYHKLDQRLFHLKRRIGILWIWASYLWLQLFPSKIQSGGYQRLDTHESHCCEECVGLFANPAHLRKFFSPAKHATVTWQRKLQEMRAASEYGCRFCQKLIGHFQLISDYHDDEGFDGILGHKDRDLAFVLTLAERGSHVLMIGLEGPGAARQEENLLLFEILVAPDDPSAEHTKGRIPDYDLGSDKNFGLANTWLRECTQDHHHFLARDTRILPSRLLDVNPSDPRYELCLCATDLNASIDYACLSYCWGKEAPSLSLTTKNMAALHTNVDYEDLPQTVRDAIQTVRRLGLRYLWIDALCIIQDSAEDKSREIQKMEQIYSNATVTISAANSDKCSIGFLEQRNRWWADADEAPIQLPFLCPDGKIGEAYLFRWGSPRHREVLHRRSWTLQEHLLSPRVLMYGSGQIFWICNHETKLFDSVFLKDGGPTQNPRIAELNYMRRILSRQMALDGSISDVTLRGLWSRLVEEYSTRDQTVPHDRVHAIRGVASRMQTLLNDKYIAGLWSAWIIPSLSWKRKGEIYPRPPRPYPTWSWLSIDSAVTMEGEHLPMYTRDPFQTRLIAYSHDSKDPHTDTLGLLPNAELHLEGLLLMSESVISAKPPLFIEEYPDRGINRQVSKIARMVPDVRKDPRPIGAGLTNGEATWCMPLQAVGIPSTGAGQPDPIGWVAQGVLLRLCQENPRVYERVGWFSSDIGEENLFLSCPRQEVTII